MKISIIITAYKESETIAKSIQSILENDLPFDYEIIIVAPDEQTLNVGLSYAKNNNRIKILKDPGKGKPNALNLVFKKVKGDILVLTDGDVFVDKKSLIPLIEKFKDPEVGAVTGHPVPTNSKKTMVGYWGNLLFDIADKRRRKAKELGKRTFCSGYLYAIRNNIIKNIPTETLSEDGLISHLIYEKSYKIEYSENSLVYVKYPTKLKDWIAQKKRSVGGYNQIKMWIGKEMRSFKKESLGILDVLTYPKNLVEAYYTFVLILARIYLWFVIFIDINIKKKKLEKIWVRTVTTKSL
jgi:cellulose synthase/poly-beta-1,6-N-acetylglucosamine synthase-like glycosyltransferase